MPIVTSPRTRSITAKFSVDGGGTADLGGILDLSKVRNVNRLPGFKAIIAQGGNASTNYSLDTFSNVDASNESFEMTYFYPGFPTQYTERFYGIARFVKPYHLDTENEDIDSRALARLYGALRSSRSHTNSMISLGELKETIELITSPAKSIRSHVMSWSERLRKQKQSIKQKHRDRQRQGFEWGQVVAGSTLELNFGLKPLLADIKESAEAIARLSYPPPVRDRFVGTAKGETSIAKTELEELRSGGGNLILVNVETNHRTVTRYTYFVGTALEQRYVSAVENFVRTLGFTPENILPTVYNLTPWSFLVDYFTGLGDVIEAISTDTSNVKRVHASILQQTTLSLRCTRTTDANQSAFMSPAILAKPTSGGFGHFRASRTTMSRTVLDSIPFPHMVLRVPPLGSSKWYNMAALVVQAVKF